MGRCTGSEGVTGEHHAAQTHNEPLLAVRAQMTTGSNGSWVQEWAGMKGRSVA